MFSKRIAIDLGTTSTRIMMPKKGLIVNEPTLVAKRLDDGSTVAIGQQALEMFGRTPDEVEAYSPLMSGVIADFRATEQLLAHYVAGAIGRVKARRPEGMITVSAGATPTERKAVLDVAAGAGLREVYLIQSPIAAALGSGIPVSEATGNMVIDIGSGTTEIAVVSLGGIVSKTSIRVGGQAIDRAIIDHVRKNYALAIGEHSAEEVKHLIGAAMPMEKRSEVMVQGRDLVGGLPKQIKLSSNELIPVIENILEQIVFAVRDVMERTPPELISDIMEHGIVITGGVARLRLLDRLLSKVIGVPIIIANNPELSVVKGAQLALSSVEEYKRSLLVVGN